MIEFKPYVHHGKELEQAVLGICLLEKLAFGRIYGLLESDHFYTKGHQQVFSIYKEMYDNSLPIDLFTVAEYLTNKGIDKINGEDLHPYLTRLTNYVVSSAHVEYHCHLIKKMWQRRKIYEIKYSQIESDFDVRKNLSDINSQINKILGNEIRQDWYDMTELMYNLMVHQSEMASGKRTFITTGFKKADDLNGGFYNGQMIVIGARPSVGKSALMGQMALEMARTGKKVGIISLEMNNNEIAARLSSIETGIDFSTIFRTIANDEKLHKQFYEKISSDTINLPIYLSDKTKVNVSEIRAKAMKLKASKGCDCIMIDYLQLIDGTTDNKNYNREQEVAKMSRGLKLMAQELDIPVIVLCQLNRNSTARSYKDRFPKLSDLRESGAIEQDADVVMFIHRDYMSGWQVDESNNSTEFIADLLAPKWRNGATFHLQLDFDPPKMKFSEQKNQFIPINIETKYNDQNPF
jgi:replicative DNA helicase